MKKSASSHDPLAGVNFPPTQTVHNPLCAIPPVEKPELSPRTSAVLRLIVLERARQEQLVKDGKLPFCIADPMPLVDEAASSGVKLAILTEEVGEVATEVYELLAFEPDATDPMAKLRTELIQVAAVAVAWLESMEAI